MANYMEVYVCKYIEALFLALSRKSDVHEAP